MTGRFNGRNWRIGALGFSLALVLGLSGFSVALAVTEAAGGPLPEARVYIDQLVKTHQFAQLSDEQVMSRLEAHGVLSAASSEEVRAGIASLIQRYRALATMRPSSSDTMLPPVSVDLARPVRVRPLKQVDMWTAEREEGQGSWNFGNEQSARSGFYPLPTGLGLQTTYLYENDTVFRSGAAPPNRSRMLDIITFAGVCPTPPAGVKSIEYVWFVNSPQTNGFQVDIRLWDTFNPAAATGTSVVTNFLGGISLDYGPLPAGGLFVDIVTLATPIFPSHTDNIGIQFDFVDNVAPHPLTSGTIFFTLGPPHPQDPPNGYDDPPTGTSDNFFYRDAGTGGTGPQNGILETNEQSFFNALPANKANFYLHTGGVPKDTETEPNNGPPTTGSNALCLCTRTQANINPVTEFDFYKFNMAAPGRVAIEIKCADGNDVSIESVTSTGTLIERKDDNLGTPCNETLERDLTAGDHYFKIDAKSASPFAYELNLTPVAAGVSGMKFSTSITPAPKSVIIWDPQPAGSTYDVVRGDLQALHSSGGDYGDPAVVTDCWDIKLPTPQTVDLSTPGVNQGLFYLARAKSSCGGLGTYDEGGETVGVIARDPGITVVNPNTGGPGGCNNP